MNRETPQVGKSYRTALVPELRSIDEGKRQITFVASTEKEDRYGDKIMTAGWDLAAYKKNPVFLFGHDAKQPPIGRTVEIGIETSPRPALVQRVQFATAAEYEFADTIFKLYAGGYMNAVSVGFLPTSQPTPIKDLEGYTTGYQFNGQELLELSAVSLPANSECLARARTKGFSEVDLARVFSGEELVAMSMEDFYKELAAIYEKIASSSLDVATKVVQDTLAKAKALGIEPVESIQDDGEIGTIESLIDKFVAQ